MKLNSYKIYFHKHQRYLTSDMRSVFFKNGKINWEFFRISGVIWHKILFWRLQFLWRNVVRYRAGTWYIYSVTFIVSWKKFMTFRNSRVAGVNFFLSFEKSQFVKFSIKRTYFFFNFETEWLMELKFSIRIKVPWVYFQKISNAFWYSRATRWIFFFQFRILKIHNISV